MGRGGKLPGNHNNCFNIQTVEGKLLGVNLVRVDWERVEKVSFIFVPKHCEQTCMEAKRAELKLYDISSYEEV